MPEERITTLAFLTMVTRPSAVVNRWLIERAASGPSIWTHGQVAASGFDHRVAPGPVGDARSRWLWLPDFGCSPIFRQFPPFADPHPRAFSPCQHSFPMG